MKAYAERNSNIDQNENYNEQTRAVNEKEKNTIVHGRNMRNLLNRCSNRN